MPNRSPPRFREEFASLSASKRRESEAAAAAAAAAVLFQTGFAFDGNRFVRTAVTTRAFNYLTCADGSENQVASLTGTDGLYDVRAVEWFAVDPKLGCF